MFASIKCQNELKGVALYTIKTSSDLPWKMIENVRSTFRHCLETFPTQTFQQPLPMGYTPAQPPAQAPGPAPYPPPQAPGPAPYPY